MREHPRREVEPCRDRVDVPRTRACPGPNKQFMRLADGDDLVHERVDGRAAAIDDALPADFDHRRVRQDSEVRRRRRLRLKLWVRERSLHEERLELRRRVSHGVSPSRRLNAMHCLAKARKLDGKSLPPDSSGGSLCRHAPALA